MSINKGTMEQKKPKTKKTSNQQRATQLPSNRKSKNKSVQYKIQNLITQETRNLNFLTVCEETPNKLGNKN